MRPFSINSCDPRIIDPTGAPSPLDKQNITESNFLVICAPLCFRATAALKRRAPHSVQHFFRAGMRPYLEGDRVARAPRRDKKGRWTLEDFGGTILQLI